MPRLSSNNIVPQHERKKTESERFAGLSFGKKSLGSSRDDSINRRRGSSNINCDSSISNSNGKGMDEKMLMPRISTVRRTRSQDRLSSIKSRIEEEEAPQSRTSSFFRLSRAPFSRKKSVERFASDESASPIATASFESQRSTASLESSNGPGAKEILSSSPLVNRGIQQPSWPRSSMTSSREGEWISDMDGNRESSDLDSLIGQNGRPWLRRNGSMASFGDSIAEAEDLEMMNGSQSAKTYTSSTPAGPSRLPSHASSSITGEKNQLAPSARIKPSRSISAFSVMKRKGSEDGVLSKPRGIAQFHYTPSTQSLRDGYSIPVSPDRDPDSLLPPLPVLQSPKTTMFSPDESTESCSSSSPQMKIAHNTQRDSLMVPSTASSTKILRKTKSQNSFLRLVRRSSFLNPFESDGDVRDYSESATLSRQSPQESPSNHNEGSHRDAKRIIFRNGKPRLNGSLNTSSRTSLVSSGFNTPVTSSPVQERLQPFFSRSSSKESLAASSDRKPYGDIIQPLTERHRSSSAATSRHASPSRKSKLQTNGGASSLFTGTNQRQRASSLLPAMSWRSKNQGSNNNMKISTMSRETEAEAVIEKKRTSVPKVDADQFNGNAERFVQFVIATISRDDIAAVLASSSDEIHKQALATYMLRFFFARDPLDIALRKLLMTLCLPKETQQIDRVMEAFAQRYTDCNEDLFDNVDQPYVLAFSLMMLHTDAFNKNARQKMSKSEYLRNTSSCGVSAEILEYLYDNLTFTQFIYVDDDEIVSRRRSEGESSTSGSFLSALSSTSNTSSTKNRIDPYYIIANEKTHTLCANIGNLLSQDNPFSTTGTTSDIDIDSLNQKFVNAPTIEVITTKKPMLASSTAAAAASNLNSEGISMDNFGGVQSEEEVIVSLRVTKIGCISRKDDIVEENKKASSRRWKTCGMLLSSSQLLFFKDLIWTSQLTQQIKDQTRSAPNHESSIVITPRLTQFKPDEVLALSDVIAVQDKSYFKYQNVLRLFAKQGESYRQYLIQAVSEADMNDWIHRINFCAAFRACGLKIRGLDLPATPSLDDNSSRSTSISLSRLGQERSSSSDLESNGKSLTDSETSNGMTELLQWKLQARRKELMPKLDLVNTKYDQCQVDLNKQLRFAKHLSILTPFMKITRERIEASAENLSQEIRRLQLEQAKYFNRRRILTLELEAGDRALKNTTFALSFMDVGTNKGVIEEPTLESVMSLDQLSLPTPSSSFSNHEFAISKSSSGNYQQIEAKESKGDVEQDAVTPKVRSNEIIQAVEGSEETSAQVQSKISSSFDQRREEASLSSSPKPAPALRGLGFEENITLIPDYLNGGSTHPNSVGKQSNRWFKTISAHSSPKEEAERWDKSKIVRDAKRVSLVTLPDAESLMDLSRMSFLYSSGAIIPDEDIPLSSA